MKQKTLQTYYSLVKDINSFLTDVKYNLLLK